MKRLAISIGAFTVYAFGSVPALADWQFEACEKHLRQTAKIDSELGQCGNEWLAREEALLKRAWRKALAETGGATTDQGQALLDEQRAWIAFKEKACHRYDLISSGSLGRFHDASVCRAEIIVDRIAELTSGLDGKGLS